MQALRWHGRGDLRLDETADPGEPTPGQAIIEVAYCGICGTDLHEYLHGPNMIRIDAHPLTGAVPPMTLGHEMSGTVVAASGSEAGISPGIRVVVDPCIRCGVCRWCRRGEYHLCAKGGSVGLAADGGFARYVQVPLENLHPIPVGVPDDLAAMAEPLAVGLHAAKRGQVQPGENVLVLGAGPIGIAALLGAKLAGAAGVYVSEPLEARAQQALRFGATEVFDPEVVDFRREVFVRTARIGPDVVIDATGRPELVDLAVRSVRRGGRVVMVGISNSELRLDLRQIVLYERSIYGSVGYNFDIPRVLDLMAAGRLDVRPLLSGVRPLSAGVEVFEELAADRNQHLKVLLTPQNI